MYKFSESLEDTRIEGTLPPGSQARKNQPVLVFTYLPKGKHIQHGLHVDDINVGLYPLQQNTVYWFSFLSVSSEKFCN